MVLSINGCIIQKPSKNSEKSFVLGTVENLTFPMLKNSVTSELIREGVYLDADIWLVFVLFCEVGTLDEFCSPKTSDLREK